MRNGFLLIILFCAFGSFAQNTAIATDKKVEALPLVIVSSGPVSAGDVTVSTAVPQPGQKYETSQHNQLLLVPVGSGSTTVNSNDAVMMSTATPLPASASTTSQSSGLILTTVE